LAESMTLIEVLKAEREVNQLMIPVLERERDKHLAQADEQHVHHLVTSYEMHYRSVYLRGMVAWLTELIDEYDV
jgi:hypothetical protein